MEVPTIFSTKRQKIGKTGQKYGKLNKKNGKSDKNRAEHCLETKFTNFKVF
jgi:hypothetical protein